MTAVPIPVENDGLDIEVTFSQMSPPDWPLVDGGCGQVANMCTSLSVGSSARMGRVWLSLTRPNTEVDQVPAPVVALVSVRLSSSTSGLGPELSLVLLATKTLPAASALRLMWSSGETPVGMALTL